MARRPRSAGEGTAAVTAAWGQPRPIDRVYAWLCRRAEAGKRMLSDKEVAERLQLRSGSAAGHHIQRLQKWKRIVIHISGVGNNVQRKIQIVATGYCTAYSRRKPRNGQIERFSVRELVTPITIEEVMAGRRFEDVRLRQRPLVPAPRGEPAGAQSSLG